MRHQSRVRGNVARQRRAGAWRRTESPAPPGGREALTGVFGVRGRWAARSHDGDLQSGDHGGCGQDPRAARIRVEADADAPEAYSFLTFAAVYFVLSTLYSLSLTPTRSWRVASSSHRRRHGPSQAPRRGPR